MCVCVVVTDRKSSQAIKYHAVQSRCRTSTKQRFVIHNWMKRPVGWEITGRVVLNTAGDSFFFTRTKHGHRSPYWQSRPSRRKKTQQKKEWNKKQKMIILLKTDNASTNALFLIRLEEVYSRENIWKWVVEFRLFLLPLPSSADHKSTERNKII